MRPTIPNLLTVARIVMIPLFLVAFYLPFGWSGVVAACLFALASATDWLDGYLARRWQQTSSFGAFLDPVADKLMVAVALIAILQKDPRILMALPVAIIIGREITVSALREWMAELGKRASVAVSVLGKLKTTVQMVAVVLLLLRHGLPGVPAYRLGVAGLYVAAALTLWSMIEYLRAAWPVLNEDRPGRAS
ncbi:MAG TPA: CDP-diacylglycerol--glycerol-3-phosphate 3-phosphatidyltransferase [Gammaproteobacteria bacterium]|nr:CDP-diacylglycerol--glycerol-3-phosphate 3-phosphatidyltransferase [Gammaproteobacteria bacterium]